MSIKVKIPEELIQKLINLPEQGMGYQVVTVTLIDGTILKERKVVNSAYLLLLDTEEIKTSDIKQVKLSPND